MEKSVFFVSLGCDKNTVDSEIMLQLLLDKGYTLVKSEAEAEIILVNTCAFILDAQEEAINTLIEMSSCKENGRCRALIAAGCLAERYADEFFESLPEVDAIVGTGSYERIAEACERVLNGETHIRLTDDINCRDLGYYKRFLTTVGYYAFLKISEGCDNFCTYCIIPKLRGKYRSRSREDILREARELAEQGVKELILVAQDITGYGRDLDEPDSLASLLKALCEVEGLVWIRLLYAYPEGITPELIRVIKEEKKILPYLDMPIQHACDSVLKRMNRRNTETGLRELITRLRAEIPDICLRTTLITGFPGESAKEFETLKSFVEEMKFDRLGVFAYSKEDGTAAARMKGQIPQKVKEARRDRLMELQREISSENSSKLVGRRLTALIEGMIPEKGPEGTTYIARTYRDAPEIDGFIFINSHEEFNSGDMVDCVVTGSYEYDLIGELA